MNQLERALATTYLLVTIVASGCGNTSGDADPSRHLNCTEPTPITESYCSYILDNLPEDILRYLDVQHGEFRYGTVRWRGTLEFSDDPDAPAEARLNYNPTEEYPFEINKIIIRADTTPEQQKVLLYKELYGHARTWHFIHTTHPELFMDPETSDLTFEFADLLSHFVLNQEQAAIMYNAEYAATLPTWDGDSIPDRAILDHLARWNASRLEHNPDQINIQPIIDVFENNLVNQPQ